MRATWIFLIATISVAFAGPLASSTLANIIAHNVKSTRNTVLEQALLDGIESIRDVILNGADGVPPLNPLQIEELMLDDDIIPFPGSKLELIGVTVSNLGTFVINNLSANVAGLIPLRYRIQLDGHIPVLDVVADHYDLNLSAMGISIFGAGDAKIKIINPRLRINILVRVSLIGGIYITLEDTTIQFFLDEFQPHITGLFHHDGASDFVNIFLQDLVPSLVENYEAEITQGLSETIQREANEILKDLDLSDFI